MYERIEPPKMGRDRQIAMQDEIIARKHRHESSIREILQASANDDEKEEALRN